MKSSPSSGQSTSSADGPPSTRDLKVYREEYLKADGFCQEVQSFMNLAGVPAVNELRNAGKHLLDAIADDGTIARAQDLQSGINHSRRASYEAYEAGILTALELINQFKIDYALVTVSDVVPNYHETLSRAHNAQQAVEAGRQPGFNREDDHAARMASFRELRSCCDALTLSRDELNKKIRNQNRSESIALNTLRAGIAAILVAVLLTLWTAAGFWVPWHHSSGPDAGNAVANSTDTNSIDDNVSNSD